MRVGWSLTERCRRFVPDVITTSRILGPLLAHTSTFVLVQNGIGVHEELRGAVPSATIISACAWVDATAVDGGNVINHGRMVCVFLVSSAPDCVWTSMGSRSCAGPA